MVPIGVSLLVGLLAFAPAERPARGSSLEVSAGRSHGVAAYNTTGHVHSEVTVVHGEGWTPDYVPSPETTILTKEAPTTAATTQDQVSSEADLGALLDAGEGAIATLVSGETRLVVHRAVLSASSPVFSAMFRQDTLEANTGEVAIPDVEGPVLRQMVGYMYTGRAPQLPSMAHCLLGAADKYGVDALKDACEQQVVAQLDVENAAAAAVLSLRHNCSTLREAIVNFMQVHGSQVMATQGWAEAARRQPEDVEEFLRLLAEAHSETSTPAATPADAIAATTAPATAPEPTAHSKTPPPDAAAVSRFRSLSVEEKGRRLIEAATVGAVEDVRALLAAGADVGAVDSEKWTALHWAALRGHVEVTRHLLEAGAAVDARNRRHNVPLQAAAVGGSGAVVRLLLAASADPNASYDEGTTALHIAAIWGRAEAVAALLEGGADRGARNKDGDTALALARCRKNWQVVDLLRGKT